MCRPAEFPPYDGSAEETHPTRCTARVGIDDRCGEQPVIVTDLYGEEAYCLSCHIWRQQAGLPLRPIHILG